LGFRRGNHVDFLPLHTTINAQYYSNLPLNDMYTAICKERHEKLSEEIILLHDNADPYLANLTMTVLASLGWEILNHPA
jgi:hypothetical protein